MPDQIFKIGSPLYEVIKYYEKYINEDFLKKNNLIKKNLFY